MLKPVESLSIAEMVVYPLILLANIFVCLRHGISRQAGFIFLVIFCIIRIVGAGFGIASGIHPDNISDLEWSAILGSVGISALLLASMFLLKRVIDEISDRLPKHPDAPESEWIKVIRYIPIVGLLYRIVSRRASATSYRSKFLQILTLPGIAGLVLCINGGTEQTSSTPSKQEKGKHLVEAGLIIFLVMYVCLVAMTLHTATQIRRIPVGEKRVLVCVLFSLPLLLVRIMWSLIAYFGHSKTFSIMNGSSHAVLVRAVMSVLEEFIIVIAYTVLGLMIPRAYDHHQGTESGMKMAEQGVGFRQQGDYRGRG